MGSIYPHFAGTQDERMGYDSFDFAQIKPAFMNLYRWAVRVKRSRVRVMARTLDEAKQKACTQRGWNLEDITDVYILP